MRVCQIYTVENRPHGGLPSEQQQSLGDAHLRRKSGCRQAGAQHLLRASDFRGDQTGEQRWLTDAPERYREPAGECAQMSGTPPAAAPTAAPTPTTTLKDTAGDKKGLAFTVMLVAVLALHCGFFS